MECDKQECCHRGKKPDCSSRYYFLCKEFVRRWSDEDVLVLQKAPVRYLRRDTTTALPIAEQQERF